MNYAYENIHFPESPEALDIARRRLAFEELFFFAIGLKLLRSRRETVSVEPFQTVDMAPFYNALPFTLTDAQRPLCRGSHCRYAKRQAYEPSLSGGCRLRQNDGGRRLRVFLRQKWPSGRR